MLYSIPELDDADTEVLAGVYRRLDAVASEMRVPERWPGLLRRNLIARAIRGSNSIEGYVVETDDAAAAVDYEEALTADERTFAEIRGYRQALGYVRIRRHGYLARAGIDERTASRDLKALTEIGLLSARGETRARHYVAGDKLLDLKLHLREDVPRTIVDPYPRLRAELLEP